MKFNSFQQIRVDILSKYLSGEIQRVDACLAIGVGERQFRRILKAFRERGVESLIHGNTGKEPLNKTAKLVREYVLESYRSRYRGLNVNHFREKLENEGIEIPSYSTTRKLLLQHGLIVRKQKKVRKVFKPRKRYEKEGLMVQIDGSHHRWFRGYPCCLIAAVDDATGKILGAKFSETETTIDSMDVVKRIIQKYGRFQILYSDKAGIYGGGKRSGYTNMHRALKRLDIISIQANTPQAKGRVERLFRTLQDRLVMEMRLEGVSSIEEANDFLQSYIEIHNNRFCVEAISPENGFRELNEEIDLERIFCTVETRKVAHGNVISYGGDKFIITSHEDYRLIGKYIEIRTYPDGSFEMYFGEDKMSYQKWEKLENAA